MDDWKLDEKSLSKWQYLQHCKPRIIKSSYKEQQILSGYHLVLVTLHRGLQLVLSKTIRLGDSKYHIWCSLNLYHESSATNLATYHGAYKLLQFS